MRQVRDASPGSQDSEIDSKFDVLNVVSVPISRKLIEEIGVSRYTVGTSTCPVDLLNPERLDMDFKPSNGALPDHPLWARITQ